MQDNKIDYKSILVSNMLPAISSDEIFDINMSALFTGNHKSKKLFNMYVAFSNFTIGNHGFHIQGMESELYQVGGLIWFLAVYSKIYDI